MRILNNVKQYQILTIYSLFAGLSSTTACEPSKTLSSSAIHLSALLSSKADTPTPENYLNLHSSSKRDSNSELDIDSSTKLNLLRFPAFKRFMDSPSVQQKSVPPRFSAFSSIKSKHGIPRQMFYLPHLKYLRLQ